MPARLDEVVPSTPLLVPAAGPALLVHPVAATPAATTLAITAPA